MASCISSELGEYPHGVTGLGLGGIALDESEAKPSS